MTRILPAAIAVLSLGLCVTSAGVAAPAEKWDVKLKNGRGFALFEQDIAVGGKPTFINGEWQGNFDFQLSNCPGAGCQTYAGAIHNSTASLDDYVGTFALPGGTCTLQARIGEDKEGMDSGFQLSLAAKGAAGCKAFPATIAGHYVPYWVNKAKGH